MKLRSFIFTAMAAVLAFSACEQKEDLGSPDIQISANQMSFEEAGGEQTLTVTATRDWTVQTDADWVVVSPESGSASSKPQTVTVTALKNSGMDRSADLKFSIGMKSRYLTVSQAGPGGSPEALIVYGNDFDKTEAVKGDKWATYLDTFDGWKNEKGTGISTVTYASKSLTARTNSGNGSAGNYSDYTQLGASGMNYLWFGTAPTYFAVKNITLPEGKTNYTLSFGTERYLYGVEENTYNWNEFSVYVSADAKKWVKLSFDFAGGSLPNGRWDLAASTFTVPAGTTSLNIYFTASLGSAYAIDDLKLVQADKAGTAIDFSAGEEFEVGGDIPGGGTGGGSQGGGESDATAIYSNNYDNSAAVQGTNGWPFLDNSDAWKNAAGTGAANVTYASKNVTVRNNANSNGTYSDYDGSGLNNIFFGKDNAYFATKNIALNGATGLTLTFGTEKHSQTLGSVFTNSEFHIWLSADGTKWVELTDYTFAGGTKEGRWNVATANFTVPTGTTNLSICMQVDAASAYRLDDMKLVASNGGTAVDFTAAVAKDFNAGASGGGNEGGETPTPPTPPAGDGSVVTIASVLALGANATIPANTFVEGVVISNMALNNLTSKKGMYIQDETAGLQFYLAADHTFAFGDKVKVDLSNAKVGAYNGAVQISSLALDKITKISSGNTVTPKTVTIADFLANKYEGQYVAIEGVQVADADLSKTFVMGSAHTSIKIENADGKNFVVFSSKYATYGTTAVPQGSGTLKGISSINNGNMQIIFAQTSDFAGLTGERFTSGSTEPEQPGEGGGNEGGEDPVTPPSGDATVAKLVMNTLGLANAAVVDGKDIKVDDNITLVFKKGGASTPPAYYDASQGIRMYQNGSTLDVKATSGKTIASIKITFDNKMWYIKADSGSLSAEAEVRTWTGSANAVKFTSTGTDKDHRAYVKAIEVTYY